MATTFGNLDNSAETARGERFYWTLALVMAGTVFLGFSMQWLMGRSTFAAPLRVHAHAISFMGWVVIFLAQARFATHGPIALHRRLGWLAIGWMGLMLTTALITIVAMVRQGTVPFFFTPQHFLIFDPLTLVVFIALTLLAIRMRRQPDWHARLQIGAMAQLTGPAFGRLLPMPLLQPWAFEAAAICTGLFILAGMIRDKRTMGRVHPAWWFGVAALVFLMAGSQLIAHSPIGDAIYQAAVAGYPGAQVPGLEFGQPPAAPPAG